MTHFGDESVSLLESGTCCVSDERFLLKKKQKNKKIKKNLKKQKTKKRNHCDGWHLDVVQWLFTKTSHISYICSIRLGKFQSTNPVWTIFIWNCNQIQTLWDFSSNGCWMWTLCQYAYSISVEISNWMLFRHIWLMASLLHFINVQNYPGTLEIKNTISWSFCFNRHEKRT